MRKAIPRSVFISEDETLGELFTEIADQKVHHSIHVARLEKVLKKLASGTVDFVFLERFHHSYYALGIEWKLLKAIDFSLANFHFKTVLLGRFLNLAKRV